MYISLPRRHRRKQHMDRQNVNGAHGRSTRRQRRTKLPRWSTTQSNFCDSIGVP